jgi:hypothetical protein
MFLFNSLHERNRQVSRSLASKSLVSGSSDRLHGNRPGVFAPFVAFCLVVPLLFSGCQPDEDNFVDDHKLNSQLIGTWLSTFDDGYADGYAIEETETGHKLTYYGYTDMISYAGVIKYVSNFAKDAGVIIIEYDDDHKASYFEYDDEWNAIGTLPLKGNFIGIYYKELKPGVSVKIGGSYIEGGAEEETLDAAKKAFTLGNTGKYMTTYGTYSK